MSDTFCRARVSRLYVYTCCLSGRISHVVGSKTVKGYSSRQSECFCHHIDSSKVRKTWAAMSLGSDSSSATKHHITWVNIGCINNQIPRSIARSPATSRISLSWPKSKHTFTSSGVARDGWMDKNMLIRYYRYGSVRYTNIHQDNNMAIPSYLIFRIIVWKWCVRSCFLG